MAGNKVRDIHVFGRDSALTTSFTPISLSQAYQTPQGSAAVAVRVKAGGNAADAAGGLGARELLIQGLDENFDYATELLATAGASASAYTTTTWTRIFDVSVSESGTYATMSTGSHSADIIIEDASANEWAKIDSTNFARSHSEIGVYSIPRDHFAYIPNIYVSVDSTKSVDVIGFYRERADLESAPYQAMKLWVELSGVSGEEVFEPKKAFGPFTGPCDVGFLGKGASTPEIDIDFELEIYN